MKFRMQNKLVLTLAFGFISVFGFSQNQEINTSQTGMSINHNHTGIVRGNSKSTISTKQQTSLSLFKAEETYEKDAIYANRKPEDELVEKRDRTSKHFQNPDGSIEAILSTGSLNYLENDKWQTIERAITPNNTGKFESFEFANTKNAFKSFYGNTPVNGIKTIIDNQEITEWQNKKIEFYDANMNLISSINEENSKISLNHDKATYVNIFPYTEAQITQLHDGRKIDYEIISVEFVNLIPVNAVYLAISEDITLPEGWTAKYYIDELNEDQKESKQRISIFNNRKEEILQYQPPVYFEKASQHDIENPVGEYQISQNGQTLTIKTMVDASWIKDEERNFPVVIDPTVSVYPNNTTNHTGRIYSTGVQGDDLMRTGRWTDGSWIAGYARLNTSSIPASSIVTAATGYINIASRTGTNIVTSTWAFTNCANTTTTSGVALYNSMTTALSSSITVQSLGWRSIAFTADGRTYMQNALANGFVNIGVYPTNIWSVGARFDHTGRSGGTNRPYLSINYTIPSGPPSCTTPISPLAGASGTAHSGNLAWEAVGGADTYDVYFGTSATPPQVATNQVATTYPLDCLLPETTYYWKVVPKNGDGSATGCATWSFTTDNKLHIYKNDWETANTGFFGTSGASVDGWYANSTDGMSYGYDYYQNIWTVGTGTNAISGKSVGVSGLKNGSLAGDYFDYWTDLGTLYRWIYRPINLTGLRDVELTFRWKGEGESSQDFGTVATSINGGNNWLTDEQGGLYSNGQYYNSHSTIRTQTLTFPDTRNNQNNFQLAFKWNDLSGNGYGGSSTFVIDDIVMKACPYEGTLSSPNQTEPFAWSPPTANTQTTITVNGTHQCAYFEWEKSIDNGTTWSIISGANSVSYTTPSNLTANTFYRCRVYFGSGCPGAYQDEAFKIVFSPDCTTELAPADGSSNQSTSIHLSWNPDPLATSYNVYFGQNYPPTTMVGNTANQYYDVDNLDYNTTYYWQILPTNAGGTASGCDVWSFTTGAAPPQFHNYGGSEQLTFNNSAYKVDAPNFRISHSTSTMDEVQIQISEDVTFPGSTVFDGTFTGSFSGENNFIMPSTPTLTPGTTYYARARGKIGGNWTDWTSDTFSFTYKNQASIEWHQTAEPQLQTNTLVDVITQASPDLATIPASGGIPSNPFTDPSFETGTGWSTSQSYSVYETYLTSNDNGTNGITHGSQCAKFAEDDYSWQSFFNGEYNNASQQVDLTGVTDIVFDVTHWRNTQSNMYSCGTGRACKVVWSFKVIIGDAGTSGDNSGTEVYSWTPTTPEFGTTNNNDVSVDISSYGFTGTKTVKFSRVVTNGGGVWYDDDKYYLDNIRGEYNATQTGTITSTPINLSSFYGYDSWNELSWDQTLNGGTISMSIEEDISGTWTPVAALTDVSQTGDGVKTIDISSLGSTSRIRVIAKFSETGAKGTQPELNNWTITTKKDTPLPVDLLYFDVQCNEQSKEFTWATASEINSDYFLIMESQDNENFKPIAKIEAAGNSNQTTEYRYSTEGLFDNAYYRLKQVDFDGKEENFSMVYNNCDNDINYDVIVYPNPFNGEEIYINSNTILDNLNIEIFDAAGRIVYKTKLEKIYSSTQLIINKQLEPGAYLLKLNANNDFYKQFVVVAK